MKILITGGRGFIGSFLAEELRKEGHDVDTFDLYDGEDICDRELVLKTVPLYDVVYHLAGVLGTSELLECSYEASRINILGALNIFDAARINGTKVVHITKPNVWLNTYSITKYASEAFAKMYHQQFKLPTVSIKWFNVYGGRQSFHCQKAVPFFIKWALANEDIKIWGSGEQTADFIHAVDAARATMLIAKHSELEGETIDVGSGEETTVNELAHLILELSGSKSKVIHLPMRAGEDELTRLKADTTKLESLGFKPAYNLKDGLKETIAWYKDNPQKA